MATDNNTNLLNLREMIRGLQQTAPDPMFLQSLFVKEEKIHRTQAIEIDIKKNLNRMPDYVGRFANAKQIGRTGFTNKIHYLPYLNEEHTYTSDDVEDRQFGGTIYDKVNQKTALAKLVGEYMSLSERAFARKREQQLAQALQTGTVVVSGNGVSYTVDFGMAAGNIKVNTGSSELTGDWSDTGADIDKQFQADAKLIRDSGAPTPNICIMGVGAGNLFLRNAKIKANLDLLKFDQGNVDIRNNLESMRATYLGTWRSIGVNIEIWVYQGGYGSSHTQYISDLKYIMTSKQIDVRTHYGKIVNLKSPFVGKSFPNNWEDQNGKAGHVTLESSCLTCLHQPDGVVVRTVDTA